MAERSPSKLSGVKDSDSSLFNPSRLTLAEVRHGTAEFCNFWCHQRDKSCLYNRGFRKSGVVQTYPLETSEG